MIKTIARDLLTLYFITKTNSYTRYFVWVATILGIGLLMFVNFLYFSGETREIGLYLLLSTISIGSAVLVHLISILWGRRMACNVLKKIELSPGVLSETLFKQLALLISRWNISSLASAIVPIGLLALMIYKKAARRKP